MLIVVFYFSNIKYHKLHLEASKLQKAVKDMIYKLGQMQRLFTSNVQWISLVHNRNIYIHTKQGYIKLLRMRKLP